MALSLPPDDPVSPHGFEAVNVFEPIARLVRRSATRDGAVPLRVVQGCVPLLEGNAAGHQVVLDTPLTLTRSWGRLDLRRDAHFDAATRALRAAVPALVAQGVLPRDGAWARRLAGGFVWRDRGALRVWTGVLVRPGRRCWLRVGEARNWAAFDLRLRPYWVAPGQWVPVVLEVLDAPDGLRLRGEVATLLPVPDGARAERRDEDALPVLGRAHADFYDAQYFAAKKGTVTRKYRRLVHAPDHLVNTPDLPDAPDVAMEVVHLAGPPPVVVPVTEALGPASEHPVACAPRVEHLRFFNAVGFRARFDGHTVTLQYDEAQRAEGAAAVTRALARALGAGWADAHPGALLYLTRYFTPHPDGEAHFFVKPWAFVRSPAGVDGLCEGHSGPGYEVMRGVVRTHVFHAAPGVFHLAPGRDIIVDRGAPLLDLLPRWYASHTEEPRWHRLT
jgi:hypothetical protein